MERLDDDTARTALTGTGWEVRDGRLVLTVTRADFKAAMAFVNEVAEVAERRNHHPDISVHWNRVTLEQWTHTVGGITQADVDAATEIATLV